MDLENILAKKLFLYLSEESHCGKQNGHKWECWNNSYLFSLFEIPFVERYDIAQKVIVLDRNDNIHETFKRMWMCKWGINVLWKVIEICSQMLSFVTQRFFNLKWKILCCFYVVTLKLKIKHPYDSIMIVTELCV
jgi:hypothetical protein